MSTQVISANRLTDGLVVYLAADGQWTERIADAQLLHGPDAGEAAFAVARAAVDSRLVIDPYLIDVIDGDSERRPTRFRELIRAKGPTVCPDIGKQAEL